jgi:hypothetical protein
VRCSPKSACVDTKKSADTMADSSTFDDAIWLGLLALCLLDHKILREAGSA